jgi:hypothetical protein
VRAAALALLIVSSLALSACTTVRPWERNELARPDMAWDPDPMDTMHEGHVYFSKEGSVGGADAGGGGCGCN